MQTVLMVSTSYPSDDEDWRGLFIHQLVAATARRTDTRLRLWAPPGPLPANVDYAASESEQRWLANLAADGGIAHVLRGRRPRSLLAPLQLLNHLRRAYLRHTDVDVYHVNWLQNALVLPVNSRPALLAVLGTDMRLLRLPFMRILIRRACRNRRVAICPNAGWMVDELQRGFGDVARVVEVPFGVSATWFAIQRAPEANPARKWLCISRLTRAKLGPLFQCGKDIFDRAGRELHVFGPMQEPIEIPDWVHYHGPVTPQRLERHWFPAAQGLITLSEHAEGRPQVMLEAMASGLPVVASALPAHTDMIHDGVDGLICRTLSDVAAAVALVELPAENVRLGDAARSRARQMVGNWDDAAERYHAIYEALLAPSAS